MTVNSAASVAGQDDVQEKLAAQVSSLEIAQDKTQHDKSEQDKQQQQQQQQSQVPPHRSHDPQYNQKRSDPFQFGSRYLGEDDDVFEFNAWDHVETDDAYKEYAEQQYAMQRQSPVSEFDKSTWWSFRSFFSLFLIVPEDGHAGSSSSWDEKKKPGALVMIYKKKA